MKLHTFYAKANPAFIQSLEHELKYLGINKITNLKKDRLNYIKFKADFNDIWKIMLYSRLVENLKIQIKDEIKAK